VSSCFSCTTCIGVRTTPKGGGQGHLGGGVKIVVFISVRAWFYARSQVREGRDLQKVVILTQKIRLGVVARSGSDTYDMALEGGGAVC